MGAPGLDGLRKEVAFLLGAKKSFNFYVAHGGTNFGFSAGANSGGKGYEPDLTSYDYDAPIDEQGRPTPKYHALREMIGAALPAGRALPPIPDPIPALGVPEFAMRAHASLWSHLPKPVASVQPKPFEAYGQNQGLVLYRTTLVGRKSGRLQITDLHDYAMVIVDGKVIGTLDRRLGEKTIELPPLPEPDAGARHPRRGDGPHQLRAGDDRPQGHHRARDARGHDADELGRVPAAARRRVGERHSGGRGGRRRGPAPSSAARSASTSRPTPSST